MFKKHLPYICVLLIAVCAVAFANFHPGTHLTGWDNIQTDLNPLLGVKRAYYAVWEEYQSLGLLAGMAHGSDLIRALGVNVLSLVVPFVHVRFVEHMLFFAGGGMGMYVLIYTLLRKEARHVSPQLLGLIGGLFYMFNYGTMQIFALPLEAFSTFFAFLPWLMWSCMRVYDERGKISKRLLVFALLSVLATPFSYVQTLFVVYALVMAIVSLSTFSVRKFTQWLKKSLALWLIILVTNMFWLVPQMYFVATGGPTAVQHAKANQLASPDVRVLNESFGTVGSFARFEGFYTDVTGHNTEPLFGAWKDYFSYSVVGFMRYALFGLILLGLVRTSKSRLLFGGLFALIGGALMIHVPGIQELNNVLLRFPLMGEIFRSPFTKFIIPYALVGGYGAASGVLYMGEKLRHISYVRFASGAIIALILLTALPAFRGEFFARDMQVKIPQEYLDTIEYFKTVDPNQRIALLPDATFWGWFYTDWGYNGSGFLWYGIEQPIISRTFDVWSESSESYFWEMKTALESERIADVEAVLDKYAVDYLILDRTLRPVSSGFKALQYDRLQAMLAKSTRITQFGYGSQIALYRFDRPAHSSAGGFVQLAGPLTSVAPSSAYLPTDDAYRMLGMYRSAQPDEAPDTIYPFRNLMSSTRLFDDQWALTETADSFVALGRIPGNSPLKDYTLVTPPTHEAPTSIELYIDGKPQTFTTAPSYELDPVARTVTVTIPKALIRSTDPTTALIYPCQQEPSPLDPSKDTRVQITRGDHLLRVSSTDRAIPCMGYELPDLDQKFGYLMKLTSANIDGRPFFMAINDSTKQQPVIEDRLTPLQGLKVAPTNTYQSLLYLIPPRFEYGNGYTLTLQNTSYRDIPSTNVLSALEVYAFPYQTLARLKLIHRDYTDTPTPKAHTLTRELNTTKRAYHAYTVDITHTGLQEASYVVLNQSYHPGWKAYIVPRDSFSQYIPWLVGRRLPDADHVRINTWAQGWKLPASCEKARGDCRIVLLFPMQYAVPMSLFGTVILLIIVYRQTRREKA